MMAICAKCLNLIIGRRLGKLCSGNKLLTVKWPVTSALDLCDTLSCHGGHFFSNDMIIGR